MTAAHILWQQYANIIGVQEWMRGTAVDTGLIGGGETILCATSSKEGDTRMKFVLNHTGWKPYWP